ncbi:MAG: hypothetical protein E6713_14585 [Sporomusaceae bacterium]|nr:hypothetical protein [Sporomusaceae bacterium]
MFDLKSVLKSYRIHELAMFILEQQHEEWGQREVPALTNAVVSRYEEIVRSLMVQMKNSERVLEAEEEQVDTL